MARYSIPGFGIVLAGALLLGCGSTWNVVVQASPDPFAGQGKFGVLPVDFSQVRVGDKSEAGYLLNKDDKERSSYADDKATLEETFRRALRTTAGKRGIAVVAAEGPGEAPFLIRPTVAFLAPGTGASRVEMGIKIVGGDGDVIDEIQLSHTSDSQTGGRLHADGEALGTLVAQYVESRVGKLDHAAEVAVDPEPPPKRAPAEVPPQPAPPPPAPVAPVAPPPPRVEPPPPPPAPPVAARRAKRPPPVKRAVVPRGKRPAAPPPPPPVGTPIATSPSFSRLEDGKSRIWIEVSDRVDVTETRSPGRVSYHLRGAAVSPGTQQLSLPTEFFSTPVSRVQLVPQGPDLDLVLDLREDVAPVYSVTDTPRGIVLRVDLPRSATFGQTDASQDPLYAPARPARTSSTLSNAQTPQPNQTPRGGHHRSR